MTHGNGPDSTSGDRLLPPGDGSKSRQRWAQRRANRDRWIVIGYLREIGQAYALDIWNGAAISSGRLYATLTRLERQGVVTSERIGDRRVWRLASP